MRLRKVCPQCNTLVHVMRSCCGCGHVFTLKRKEQVSADKSMGKAVKRRRALETVEDTLLLQSYCVTTYYVNYYKVTVSVTTYYVNYYYYRVTVPLLTMLINPRRACAARVTVVVLCMYVCVSTHTCRLAHWNHKKIPTDSAQYKDRFKFCRFS